MFVSRHKIRFDDVDGAGIVYYPRYFHFCHKSFEDFFNERAEITYPTLINQLGIGFPTVKITSEFSKPLYYGDEIISHLSVSKIGQSSLDCTYQFFCVKDNSLCFSADIVVVCMDVAKKCSLSIPLNLRETFSRIMASRPGE